METSVHTTPHKKEAAEAVTPNPLGLPLLDYGASGTMHVFAPTLIMKSPHISHPKFGNTTSSVAYKAKIYAYIRSLPTSHQHILTSFENTDLDIDHCLLLAYHPLGCLRKFIRSTVFGTWPETTQILKSRRLHWGQQIASALVFLHGHGMLHGDLTAANTLVTDTLDVVLCDFGTDFLNGQGEGDIVRCTRWYRFLDDGWDGDWENFGKGRKRDAQNFSVKDDIWGLGMICYEMWCLKRMWGDREERERVGLYWRKEWPSLEGTGEVGQIIEKCWNDEYESADEVLHAIENIRKNEGLGVVPSSNT
ncbi:kinase-like protein [Mollisia scopiformis]|uniref:Kinase-like protein n=1 Tax=Mollisia scopiformis TaxID=149040 RepID=A0A194X884_MOLSC|nr:kinase-like protein [Mollisia scopiformis]KUJ16376.1 kinase-like protein [Mollisia scopiformis]